MGAFINLPHHSLHRNVEIDSCVGALTRRTARERFRVCASSVPTVPIVTEGLPERNVIYYVNGRCAVLRCVVVIHKTLARISSSEQPAAVASRSSSTDSQSPSSARVDGAVTSSS